MRKPWKAVLCVILSVWIFVIGFELGIYRERRTAQKVVIVTTTQAPATAPTEATAAPTAPAEESGATTLPDDWAELLSTLPVDNTTTAAPTTTTETQKDPANYSKAEIIKQVNDSMKALEATQNMTALKVEETSISVTDCSVKAAVSLVNRAFEQAGINETVTYKFVNGQAVGYDANGKATNNGAAVTPQAVLPPTGSSFSLAADGVQSASAQKEGANTVYTVKLVPESSTLDNPAPPYNSRAIGYVQFGALNMTGVTINEVNLNYPGSVLTVTTDANDRIVKLTATMPLTGTGSARVTIFNGTASFEGTVSAGWSFSY